MPGIEDRDSEWRNRVRDPGMFEELKAQATSTGVGFVFGKYKGKDEWAVQSIAFSKEQFPVVEDVEGWLVAHVVKEQPGTFEDVKMASTYDLILTYEDAIMKPCLVGLAKYVPELESRGFIPEEGKAILFKGSTQASIDVVIPSATQATVADVIAEAKVKPDVHVHLGDEPDPEEIALKREFQKNRVKITEALLKQLTGE